MEGECRIESIVYLRINHFKAVILTTLLTLTLVGLLLLKYFKQLRAIVFYDTISHDQLHDITHVYVKGNEKAEQISEVIPINYENQTRMVF